MELFGARSLSLCHVSRRLLSCTTCNLIYSVYTMRFGLCFQIIFILHTKIMVPVRYSTMFSLDTIIAMSTLYSLNRFICIVNCISIFVLMDLSVQYAFLGADNNSRVDRRTRPQTVLRWVLQLLHKQDRP